MAETSIAVQPTAAAPTAAQPAPLALKLFSSTDPGPTGAAIGGVVAQGMCLVDDQGRAYLPMTEATGQKIVRLLDRLCRIEADAQGLMYQSDDIGPTGV